MIIMSERGFREALLRARERRAMDGVATTCMDAVRGAKLQ
jgi:hypothetical protein